MKEGRRGVTISIVIMRLAEERKAEQSILS